jgi:hypothetical protein
MDLVQSLAVQLSCCCDLPGELVIYGGLKPLHSLRCLDRYRDERAGWLLLATSSYLSGIQWTVDNFAGITGVENVCLGAG